MIMDTSKNYYETVMRDFTMYARGRTLEQYCRDEAVDYKWLTKAQSQYGIPEKNTKAKASRNSNSRTPDMIRLHFEPGDNAEKGTDKATEAKPIDGGSPDDAEGSWSVTSLTVKTPSGYEIEIRTDKPSAVSELLTKLTA